MSKKDNSLKTAQTSLLHTILHLTRNHPSAFQGKIQDTLVIIAFGLKMSLNSLNILSLLLCCTTLVIGELCTPDQWEGTQRIISGTAVNGNAGVTHEQAQVSYDAKNMRLAYSITLSSTTCYKTSFVLMRYDASGKTGTAFVVDRETNKCTISKVPKPFNKSCVPDYFKFVRDSFLGVEGKGLLMSTYTDDGQTKEGLIVNIMVTKEEDGTMFPVSQELFGKENTVEILSVSRFEDITRGIKNATIFDIPAQCKKGGDFSFKPLEQLNIFI